MSEMVERVARALLKYLEADAVENGHYFYSHADHPVNVARGDIPVAFDGELDLKDVARAIILALREPTEAMLVAVVPDEPGDDEHQKGVRVCRELEARDYRAMIDAALTTPEAPDA